MSVSLVRQGRDLMERRVGKLFLRFSCWRRSCWWKDIPIGKSNLLSELLIQGDKSELMCWITTHSSTPGATTWGEHYLLKQVGSLCILQALPFGPLHRTSCDGMVRKGNSGVAATFHQGSDLGGEILHDENSLPA